MGGGGSVGGGLVGVAQWGWLSKGGLVGVAQWECLGDTLA